MKSPCKTRITTALGRVLSVVQQKMQGRINNIKIENRPTCYLQNHSGGIFPISPSLNPRNTITPFPLGGMHGIQLWDRLGRGRWEMGISIIPRRRRWELGISIMIRNVWKKIFVRHEPMSTVNMIFSSSSVSSFLVLLCHWACRHD